MMFWQGDESVLTTHRTRDVNCVLIMEAGAVGFPSRQEKNRRKENIYKGLFGYFQSIWIEGD
jgi:hypothetical protein